MFINEGKYNVKAITKMLGIQAGTLRAWERRYKIIAPLRNESGHRLYTDEHVKILKWLIDKVNKGFTISQAVSLLESTNISSEIIGNEQVEEYARGFQRDLVEALTSFDEQRAHEILNKAFSLYTIDKVVIDILGSVLVEIGELWEMQSITSAHEHFATSFLRSRIGMILHNMPLDGMLPKVITVCAPDEQHELGLLIYTLFLRRKGFEVIYLGTSIAEGDLEIVLAQVKPRFLFISCTMEENILKTVDLVRKINERFGDVEIGVGGRGFSDNPIKSRAPLQASYLGNNKADWEQWLKARLN